MGNPGSTLSAYRDMQSQARAILEAAKHGPLQSLADREMDVREQPMTIYPRPKRVRAWVRFGPEVVRVDAKLVRSTPLAAASSSAPKGRPSAAGCGATPCSSTTSTAKRRVAAMCGRFANDAKTDELIREYVAEGGNRFRQARRAPL